MITGVIMKVRVVWKPEGIRNSSRGAQIESPPQALLDSCAHILWGVDDGPSGIDQSIACSKWLSSTEPPISSQRRARDLSTRSIPRIIAPRVDEIRARCDGSIRIHTGCALHFGLGNIRDALINPHKYAINGRTHLLVEFFDVVIPPASEDILAKFHAKGIVPVISRRKEIRSSNAGPNDCEFGSPWAACFSPLPGRSPAISCLSKRCAWDLLAAGMVHAIASDAHDTLHRPPRLDAAWRRVKQKFGE